MLFNNSARRHRPFQGKASPLGNMVDVLIRPIVDQAIAGKSISNHSDSRGMPDPDTCRAMKSTDGNGD